MANSYKEQRYLIYFILSMMVLVSSTLVAVGIDRQIQYETVEAYASDLMVGSTQEICEKVNHFVVEKIESYMTYASSKPRVVEYDVLVQKKTELSAEDYNVLCRIVQAEAGCEDLRGKILVANVVLNRVKDQRFPDSVSEVVFQYSGDTAQFSPVSDGSFYEVCVSNETIEAVNRALRGEDYSEGALYFAARRLAGTERMRWFDRCLTKLFVYGGHEFFL